VGPHRWRKGSHLHGGAGAGAIVLGYRFVLFLITLYGT
jgi:hypothetical protein